MRRGPATSTGGARVVGVRRAAVVPRGHCTGGFERKPASFIHQEKRNSREIGNTDRCSGAQEMKGLVIKEQQTGRRIVRQSPDCGNSLSG